MTLLRGTVEARLVGDGPYDGQDGEVVLGPNGDPPPTLAFPPGSGGGGFVYRFDSRSKKAAVYRYAPDLSPAHAALVRADAEAVAEVARQRNMTVPELLAWVAEQRRTAGQDSPADLLVREAERRGLSVAALIAEHEQRLALTTSEGVHL